MLKRIELDEAASARWDTSEDFRMETRADALALAIEAGAAVDILDADGIVLDSVEGS